MALRGVLHALRGVPSYRELLGRLAAGRQAVVTALNAAKPVLLSALWQEMSRPLLVVCPRPEDARRLVDQLAIYCGDEAAVYHFAESELLPYERMAVDHATVHQRLGVLGMLNGSTPGDGSAIGGPLVVASALGLMQKTISPELFEQLVYTLRVGDKLALEPTLSRWARMGYQFGSAVEEAGMVSRRGGIVDIFTPGAPMPARIELWGDQVDSIRLFDLGSQRSVRPVEALTILPALEVLPSVADRQLFDDLARQLDFSNCKTGERDQVQEELADLLAGVSEDHAAFYAGFFNTHTLLDHLKAADGMVLVVDEPEGLAEAARLAEANADKLRLAKEDRGELPMRFPASVSPWDGLAASLDGWSTRMELTQYHQPSASMALAIPYSPPPSYQGQMDQLSRDMGAGHGPMVIATQHSQRVAEVLREAGVAVREATSLDEVAGPDVVSVVHVVGADGWTLHRVPDAQAQEAPLVTLLTDTELFGSAKRRVGRARSPSRRPVELEDLVPGQYLVHSEHGVAKFLGSVQMDAEGTPREYLVLQYAEDDKLYVPLEHLDRVAPYNGGGEGPPALTRLGGQDWARTISRAKESVKRLAFDLLQLYAQRELVEGHAFPPDNPWQRQMEDAFPFAETPDQTDAIGAVKADMEEPQPMDRLVCGDVGYGKTEVAVRAAFKAVLDNKQVAVLVPTTVLAQQHYATFAERFSGFPVRVEVLSRFRTDHEQDQVVAALKRGEADIVIGTHRLLQKDVGFKDLGLVVVDEEHRFGVGHKETLKNLRREVDVLTMTATPIPRTLHMAMAGIRDISTMETPPEQRLPIKTYLAEASDDLVREAILRELDRGGQVFYLHNRVKSIDLAAEQLRQLVPEATFLVAHGQMPEDDLSRVMASFADGAADVLLCTTIIESGLDMPAVNTLIVERADRFGLAQLYQLRGRIGRRSQRAYAYLLIPKGRKLTDTAQRRLQTILAATELGAGFRIAMKDIEIRGAGNLLGAEQSGHIHTIGYDLYLRLLAEAVEELRGSRSESAPATPNAQRELPNPQIDLGLPASIPEELVEHLPSRMALYQRMAKVQQASEVDDLTQELRDRFGRLPDEVYHLLYGLRIRVLARLARVESVARRAAQVTLKLFDPIGGARLPLERALGYGVTAGHQQVHLPLSPVGPAGEPVPWGQALLEVLERLAAFQRQAAELLPSGA